MLDLGKDEVLWHRQLIPDIQKAGIDIFISVGELSKAIAEGLPSEGHHISIMTCRDAQDAMRHLKELIEPQDVVLVKGSRAMGLERVSSFLEESLKKRRGTVLVL